MKTSEAARSDAAEIWIHAVAAKAGGGITYLKSLVPELIRQLDGRNVRVIVLLPGPWDGVALPDWFEVRALSRVASNPLLRVIFDQVVFPAWLARRPNARVYCTGSFAPVVKTAPTVVLLCNTIYFDEEFLRRELPLRRMKLRALGALIAWAARGCSAIHYPSATMRALVEAYRPALKEAGFVNYLGVSEGFVAPGGGAAPIPSDGRMTFLYVMNYSLQKNLGFVLRALARARALQLPVRVLVTSRLERGPRACFAADRALIEQNRLVEDGYLVPVGPTFGAELVALYERADACLFPSISESFGHPLVEAQAMGKSIICADRAYAREICGEGAIYVDPERPEDLVEIWRTYGSRHAVARPSAARDVRARFSPEQHVANLIEALLGEAAVRSQVNDVGEASVGRAVAV